MFVLGQTHFNQLAAQPAKPGPLIGYEPCFRFQQVGVTMKSPFQVANWSSRLVSTFYHLLLQHITCRTLHIKHCMSHIARYITIHALTCLFQISCSSFCFVSALIEWGQVIPLHVVSADSMADFETALVCLYVTHSMLHIDCYTWHVAHCTSQNMNMIQHSVIECGKDVVFVFETEHIIHSNFNFSNLPFLHWYWLSFSIARSTPFIGNRITMTLSHVQWIERYTYQSDDYITRVPWLHFAFYARVIEHVQCYVVPYTCLTWQGGEPCTCVQTLCAFSAGVKRLHGWGLTLLT